MATDESDGVKKARRAFLEASRAALQEQESFARGFPQLPPQSNEVGRFAASRSYLNAHSQRLIANHPLRHHLTPRRRLSALLSAFLFPIAGAAASQEQSVIRLDGTSISTARIDSVSLATMRKAGAPGLGIAIFNGGKVAYLRTYGSRDIATGQPTHTGFCKASGGRDSRGS